MSLPTDYQTFIHVSRYARWKPEEHRRETWEESVDRYMTFFVNHLKSQCNYTIPTVLYDEVRLSILRLEVMPSMRCIMTAGQALFDHHMAGYNCSYTAVDHPRVLDEILYILMCGTGVGFSVERQYIQKLPEVPAELIPIEDDVIIVEDSKIGWADAYRQLIDTLYDGSIPSFDVSKVRPAGARLNTFGGRASGPAPLMELFGFTISKFKKARGRQLQSIELHDIICKIGDIVVVGGVRRSATLSLSNPSDARMRDAKTGQWWVQNPHRALANNSAAYTEKPDMEQFFKEWLSLYESKSGERGIFNRKACQEQAKKIGRREWNHDFGCNPCVPGETWVFTTDGPRQVSDLIDIPFTAVVNGKPYKTVSDGFFKTGNKMVYEVMVDGGQKVQMTDNHKVLLCNPNNTPEWIELSKVSVGDYIGLSNHNSELAWIGDGGTKAQGYLSALMRNTTDIEYHSSDFYKGYFTYFYAKAMTIDDTEGLSYLKVPNTAIVQRMLSRVGIGGSCESENTFCMPSQHALRFLDWIGRGDENNEEDNEDDYNANIFVQIVSISPIGYKDVYDVTIDEVHEFDGNGFRLHNCSEIILRSAELCNLSEVVVHHTDTIDTLIRKARIAAILGTWQATLTNFTYVRDIWRKNCEEEALLGVSLTGIMDNLITSGLNSKAELIGLLTTLKHIVIDTNQQWARKLNIKQSVATTCVKPSGTVSQLVDCASGIHPRWGKYYIRTVRADNKDPLCVMMKDMGFPYEPAMGKEDHVTVFSFPVAAPAGCATRADMTAIQTLELWLTYQTYYCEHKPSITVNVREHEWMEVGAWVYKHFDSISGISFLPYDDHTYPQAPYQEINEEKYLSLLTKMPKEINWHRLRDYEKEDTTKSSKTYACSADHCEVVDLV